MANTFASDAAEFDSTAMVFGQKRRSHGIVGFVKAVSERFAASRQQKVDAEVANGLRFTESMHFCFPLLTDTTKAFSIELTYHRESVYRTHTPFKRSSVSIRRTAEIVIVMYPALLRSMDLSLSRSRPLTVR